MALDPGWRNVRSAIAYRFKDNDFGYASHGTMAGMAVLKGLDLRPSECAQMSILDYGCGTGREARCLSQVFKHVYAFDPTPQCLDEFRKENKLCEREFPNITLIGSADQIPDNIDVAYSMHVIEHLGEEDAQFMIDQLKKRVKGKTLLAYHAGRNRKVLGPYLSEQALADDHKRIQQENRTIRVRLFEFNRQEAPPQP